ncbi:flagellar basal body-associated FliL family protein [Rhizobium alvei]|uniref:Flagellar protein FliL n=1 Tax=Rhizobium alvei TaxID=1132659 RepID=A0ABT8YFU8_9HYPH|nr:flagellar basal body-associated FliL family protein [Rhizobium alvei]MDO6962566.1 flagellar basal body-associated FliL family protein [Rhizobium alvei]
MTDLLETEEPQPKKKSTLVPTIAIVAVLTAIAGGGGWFLGGMLAQQVTPAPAVEKKPEPAPAAEGEGGEKKEEGLPHLATEENGVVQLEPITSNLAFPADRWVRLEVALMFREKPDEKIAEAVHQDILMYLRTVTLQQIEGPRGFQFLKSDLQERADILTEGKVSNVLIRAFVIQ